MHFLTPSVIELKSKVNTSKNMVCDLFEVITLQISVLANLSRSPRDLF